MIIIQTMEIQSQTARQKATCGHHWACVAIIISSGPCFLDKPLFQLCYPLATLAGLDASSSSLDLRGPGLK